MVAVSSNIVLWHLAHQSLASLSNVLQPALQNVAEPLQVLPQEGASGIAEFVAILPVLEKIGLDTLTQISELAADGVTIEEAQQALDILRNQLSAEELSKLLTVFNLEQ
ncbi:hypothetical protein HKBW3S25_01879 [Candidatus Hakubella thermalkaliphila]|uniref:Uncharacterized protein n=1 Tax=Candidatus Hakubella thermalkaliphila TaxID=2754717 RepID=A0A6V8P6H7_9ACTN|nr:hypothetical protein HKBW3S25_01879 [Candidatus Hakubella thermalkaliphila]